jgi:hypothetical protein
MGVVAATSSAPATGPNVVREGLVASPLMRVGYKTMGIVAALTLIVTVLAFVDAFGLRWGSRQAGGFLTVVANPAPGYLVGIFVIVILSSLFFRMLTPRRRDVGMAALWSFRRTLRKRDGIRLLLAPGSLRPGIVVLSLLWIGMAAMAINNLGSLGDEGFDLGFGMYASVVLPIIGVIAAVCVWPAGAETVYMDRQGVITRG